MVVSQMKFVQHVSVSYKSAVDFIGMLYTSLVAQLGMITEATGSAYIEMCKTKVICAVCVDMDTCASTVYINTHLQVWTQGKWEEIRV